MGFLLFGDDYNEMFPFAHAVGRRHLRNDQQDAAVVTDWLCAVADGVGGHVNGARASRTALATLAREINGPQDAGALKDTISEAHEMVCTLADGPRRNAATTLVAAVVLPDFSGVTFGWCGDSRAWLFTGREIEQLTKDHADIWGGLTHCLGAVGDAVTNEPEFGSVPAGLGHQLLLTTDGVHGYVGDGVQGWPALLATGLGLSAIVDSGTARGTDNATAVLIDVDAWVARCSTLA